ILPTGVLTAPASIVIQTSAASAIYATKASIKRREMTPASITNQNNWCTGEDSNLRSSKERQIYSLLPLTTRPPVQRKLEPMTRIELVTSPLPRECSTN